MCMCARLFPCVLPWFITCHRWHKIVFFNNMPHSGFLTLWRFTQENVSYCLGSKCDWVLCSLKCGGSKPLILSSLSSLCFLFSPYVAPPHSAVFARTLAWHQWETHHKFTGWSKRRDMHSIIPILPLTHAHKLSVKGQIRTILGCSYHHTSPVFT